MTEPPDIIDERTPGELRVRENEALKLTCEARGNPAPRITWKREDGHDLHLTSRDEHKGQYSVDVYVHRNERIDLCDYYSLYAPRGGIKWKYEFVQYIRTFNVDAENFHMCVCILHNTRLSLLSMENGVCAGTGGSFRNKSHGGPSVYSVDGETLRINQVSKRHMGVYYCIASNGVPPSVSKRVAVTVLCEFIIRSYLIYLFPSFFVVYLGCV